MIETLVTVVLVGLALGFLLWRVWRRTHGRRVGQACAGCSLQSACSVLRPGRVPPAAQLLLLLTGVALVVPVAARAADTVETWEAGAADVDFYLGYDGMGAAATDRSVYGEIMVGYGLVRHLSVYLGTTLAAPDSLADGEPSLCLGVFGTLLDTAHLDLDLFLDVAAGGERMTGLELTPAFELNLDRAPERAAFGAYLRGALVLHGHEVAPEVHRAAAAYGLEPGVYVSLREGHQLCAQLDLHLHPGALAGERQLDLGAAALGYNVVLNETLELITQVAVSLPERGERAALSLMLGFIATLPQGGTGSTAKLAAQTGGAAAAGAQLAPKTGAPPQ